MSVPGDGHNEQRTSELVSELARTLGPVQRIPRLRVLCATLLGVALVVTLVTSGLLGLRSDVRTLSFSAGYAGVVVGLLLLSVGGAIAALGAGVPGRGPVVRVGLAAVGAALLVLAITGFGLAAGGAPVGPLDAGWLATALHCVVIASAVGLLPAALLLRFLGRAHPFRPAATRVMGASAMVAFGSLAVHLTCPADELVHVGVAHLLTPLAIGVLLGVALPRALPAIRAS